MWTGTSGHAALCGPGYLVARSVLQAQLQWQQSLTERRALQGLAIRLPSAERLTWKRHHPSTPGNIERLSHLRYDLSVNHACSQKCLGL